MYIYRIKITKNAAELNQSQDFLLHYYKIFINTSIFASQGFLICRTDTDQKPLAREDEIPQGQTIFILYQNENLFTRFGI